MSTSRTMPSAYSREHAQQYIEGTCRWCGKGVPDGRQTYCSDKCVHEWRLRTDPGYVRQCVFERDHGVCASCGLDTEWIASINAFRRANRIGHRASLWDADHIKAVVDDGGECALDNFQTLCVWCHRRKSAKARRND